MPRRFETLAADFVYGRGRFEGRATRYELVRQLEILLDTVHVDAVIATRAQSRETAQQELRIALEGAKREMSKVVEDIGRMADRLEQK